ncbi:MAG: hydrogenase maturation nickel metallochaperone HypA [Anaerolineae bacterium]|jgi:hydrogenase nickel incorporation protein HypA/HybF|nr:hydrogenase maturation nickel metallochaperone HypA [Chloroflexota bacterium]
MHELAVTESIIEIATRNAAEAGASRVLAIHLVVGDLSSIVDDSVQFYFDFLSEGTMAAGARLMFERVSVELACAACGWHWQPVSADWQCPHCGQRQAKVVKGREFYVDSIEVEDTDDDT